MHVHCLMLFTLLVASIAGSSSSTFSSFLCRGVYILKISHEIS